MWKYLSDCFMRYHPDKCWTLCLNLNSWSSQSKLFCPARRRLWLCRVRWARGRQGRCQGFVLLLFFKLTFSLHWRIFIYCQKLVLSSESRPLRTWTAPASWAAGWGSSTRATVGTPGIGGATLRQEADMGEYKEQYQHHVPCCHCCHWLPLLSNKYLIGVGIRLAGGLATAALSRTWALERVGKISRISCARYY